MGAAGLFLGTTLALAYAEVFPARVRSIVLASVTTTSRWAVDWITRGVGAIFPEPWERFANFVPERLRGLPLCEAYAALLFDRDPAVRDAAARAWCAWENAHVSLAPGFKPYDFEDAEFRLGFARLVTHYWRHGAFLGDDELVQRAGVLNGIPGVMLHGRYDVSGPLRMPWELGKRWKSCRLEVVLDAGHGGSPSFKEGLLQAVGEMAGR